MRLNEFYKNIHNTDVAIFPLYVRFVPQKGVYKVKVRWFNIVNPENVFDMNLTEEIQIKVEDMKNWKIYE